MDYVAIQFRRFGSGLIITQRLPGKQDLTLDAITFSIKPYFFTCLINRFLLSICLGVSSFLRSL
jgi:hypothetical protein